MLGLQFGGTNPQRHENPKAEWQPGLSDLSDVPTGPERPVSVHRVCEQVDEEHTERLGHTLRESDALASHCGLLSGCPLRGGGGYAE